MSGRGAAAAEKVAPRFGENLACARRRAGLSQEELASLTSLHRTAVGKLECGQRLARLDTLVKLTSVLEISAEELLAGIHWVPARSSTGRFSLSTLPAPRADVTAREPVLERAAALRAGQPEAVDAAALAREARGELERRGS